MVRTALLVMLLSAVPIGASAADWIEIASNRELTLLVDQQSLRQQGTRVKLWTKGRWVKPQDILATKQVFQSQVQQQVVNCSTGSLAVLQTLRYAEPGGGDLIDSHAIEEVNAKFADPAPDSFGEAIAKFACKPSTTGGK
jgi:hypothetical protein